MFYEPAIGPRFGQFLRLENKTAIEELVTGVARFFQYNIPKLEKNIPNGIKIYQTKLQNEKLP
jgi:hypothetical protein